MTNAITREDLMTMLASGTLKESHTSLTRGYVSRVFSRETPQPYDGRFGKGYTIRYANFDSTNYCYITYYIKK